MAHKPSPNSLIHCPECGEDYSATYKKCPFCGAKLPPQQPASDRSESTNDLEDTYVFDGQELFDDNGDDGYTSTNTRGGKRLAEKPFANPFANPDINWPRVITFVCSLVIIVAAMIIVFTVIYPQLRGDPTVDNSQNPSSPGSQPGSTSTENPESPDPGVSETLPDSTDPVTEPPVSVPPTVSTGPTSISFKREKDADFTLSAGESHTITLSFTPANWSGTVTWTSTDSSIATVDSNGKVTNVNTTGKLRSVVITATAGGHSVESKVYCKSASATQPSASAAPSSDPPAGQTPSGSGSAVGKQGTVVNADGGLNVRSGPGTSHGKIGSLFNGTVVTILEETDNGWYKISFPGTGGAATEGYVKGDYISVN